MLLHGGKAQEPSRITNRASELIEEFKASRDRLAINASREVVQLWCPPPGTLFKLNFDAAVFKDTESSGFGAVIRNSMGEVMAALSAKGPPVANSEEAEILACRKALEFAVEAGFQDVVVEGDNATVMNGLTADKPVNSWLGYIYEDTRCLARRLRSVSASCVRRGANGVAHSLAKFARQLSEDYVWLEEQPTPAIEALYVDSFANA